MTEFIKFNSIKRRCNEKVTITEKINGTNSCIIVKDGLIVGTQSRNLILTLKDDNAGFCRFVTENKETLEKFLDDGYHYGEWAGEKIQGNTQDIQGKKLFLFDYFRYDRSLFPEQVTCVDVLYKGDLNNDTIYNVMEDLRSKKPKAEGVIIFSDTWKYKSKETFEYSKGKYTKENK